MKEFATLAEFAAFARERAQAVEVATSHHANVTSAEETAAWESEFLNPNPNTEECRFCRAMATCPAWTRKVEDTLGMSLEAAADCFTSETGLPAPVAPDRLSTALKMAPGIEAWIKAVRAEGERRLLAGQVVEGFGLELGRQGAREWTDAGQAETLLRKTFRIKVEDAYDLSLKSPTSIEKLAPKVNAKTGKAVPLKEGQPEPVLGLRQWEKLQPLISRAPAKPSVKPISEIKTPYVPEAPSTEAFTVVEDDSTEDLA